MAFYLKLPERDNTQGCPARQTPAPGLAPALCPNNSELCQLCPALLPLHPLAMLQKPHNAPNTGRNVPRMRCFALGV